MHDNFYLQKFAPDKDKTVMDLRKQTTGGKFTKHDKIIYLGSKLTGQMPRLVN